MSSLLEVGSIALAFGLWGVLPGYLVLRAVMPSQRRAATFAMAPGVSVALAACLAYAADALGLGATVPSVALGLALVLAGLRLAHRARSGRWRLPAPVGEPRWTLLGPLAAALAVLALTSPLRNVPVLPPTLHDGLDHATWFRLVYELGRVDRFVILAPPFTAEGAPAFYPLGLHAFAALVARTAIASPVVTFTHVVHLLTACIPLTVYAWVTRLDGRRHVATLAAWMCLGFYWLPFHPLGWGGFALLAGAACLLPAATLASAALERGRPEAWALAASTGLGLLVVHPSQAMGALTLALVAVFVRSWPHRHGRLAAVVAVAALAAISLEAVAEQWAPLEAFLARARAEAPSLRRPEVWGWPVPLYTPPRPPERLMMSSTLLVAATLGALLALVRGRGRPLLALHVALSAMLALATLELPWTAFWYHAPERLWYLQVAALPGLGAVGVEGLVQLVRRPLRARTQWVRVVAIAALALGAAPFATWVSARFQRWARSPDAFLDRRTLVDFAWMEEHLPADELVLNSPADHGLLMAMTGRRAVFWAGGVATRRPGRWHEWLRALQRPSRFRPEVQQALVEAGIRSVYLAEYFPITAPPHAPLVDRSWLAGHPAFELLHSSPSGLVLRLRDRAFDPRDVPRSTRPWATFRVSPREHRGSVGFRGFYPLERRTLEDGSEELWRWAPREAQVTLERFPVEPGCWLELLPQPFRPHRLRINGEVVVPSDHPVPPERMGDVLEVEVRSDTFVAAGDPRDLGVQLAQVLLTCRPDGEPTRLSLLPGVPDPAPEADPRLLEASGLHDLERLPSGRRFRWTDGAARFRFDTAELAGPCWVLVAYVGARTGSVWIDGARSEPQLERYVLPGSVRWSQPITLAFEATDPFVPREREGTADERELGIRFDELIIRCWD